MLRHCDRFPVVRPPPAVASHPVDGEEFRKGGKNVTQYQHGLILLAAS